MADPCGIWWWVQSLEAYCRENPNCKDCQQSGSGGSPSNRILEVAPREVNQQAAILTLMLTRDYREVLIERPVLQDAFRMSVLPSILHGDGILLLDTFARSLNGDGYSSDQLLFTFYFKLFSTIRTELGRLVQEVEKYSPSDQARQLSDFFKHYGIEVDEVQALDLARVGTGNPRIAMSCANLLAEKNKLKSAQAAYSHVIDLAPVDSDGLELTKAALNAQIAVLNKNEGFRTLNDQDEIKRLEGFIQSLT
jgi:hypothetical protein